MYVHMFIDRYIVGTCIYKLHSNAHTYNTHISTFMHTFIGIRTYVCNMYYMYMMTTATR